MPKDFDFGKLPDPSLIAVDPAPIGGATTETATIGDSVKLEKQPDLEWEREKRGSKEDLAEPERPKEELAAPEPSKEATTESESTKGKLADSTLPEPPKTAEATGSGSAHSKEEKPERRQAAGPKSHRQIHGPYRLMRLLPHASRPLLSRMLAVDPSKRATMKDIFEDEWFCEVKYCTEDDRGTAILDPSHKHNLEGQRKTTLIYS